MSDVDLNIRRNCCADNCCFNHDVTVDDMKDAVKCLKSNKKDPTCDLYSNNFINGSNILFFHLLCL